jgi:hypothetical protein
MRVCRESVDRLIQVCVCLTPMDLSIATATQV